MATIKFIIMVLIVGLFLLAALIGFGVNFAHSTIRSTKGTS